MSDSEEWLTPREAAALVRLSVGTLANHRNKRVGIPYSKLSAGRTGRVRYRRSDVERWLAGGSSASGPEAQK